MKKTGNKPTSLGVNPELPYIKCDRFSCEVYVPEGADGRREYTFVGKCNSKSEILRILERHRNE